MEKQKFVVWTQLETEVVKFKGFDDKGRKTGEFMTLSDVSISDSEKWEIDREDGCLFKSFKVLHPHWEDGIYTDTTDVRLKFPDGDTLVNAFEVTFLMTPSRFNHPRNERAWIKRVILGGDTTLELQIPDDWSEDKFWPRFTHRKVSELKAGDELCHTGKAIDGENGINIHHIVKILNVSPLGKAQVEKLKIIALEVTANESLHVVHGPIWSAYEPIWLDGIPFTCPLSEEKIVEIERLASSL